MPRVTVLCATCGKEFERYTDSRHPNKRYFCSKKCLYERNGPRKKITCPNCGKVFIVANYSNRRFCSNKCYREYTVGENHPTFKVERDKMWRENISKGVYRSIIENKHGQLVEALRNHKFIKDFKYYVLLPMPDAIAVDFENKKVYAIELERKDVKQKMKNWKVEHDFDGVYIFNGDLEVVVHG